MSRFLGVLLTASLATSCLSERRSQSARDRDGDGFQSWELGGADCDDSLASVNPDAQEVCANGLDDDCDGITDDGGTGESVYYLDVDGDGVPGSTPNVACSVPDGAAVELIGQSDCDDSDPARAPGLMEVWYDGIDQNCDGNDDDADGDGFALDVDCDDTREDVNPGSIEICGNGIDDDCDAGGGRSCWYPSDGTLDDVVFAAIPAESLSDVADQNGDGIADLLVVANGEAHLFRGPLQPGFRSLQTADVSFTTSVDVTWCGISGLGVDIFATQQKAVFCARPDQENVDYWTPPYIRDQGQLDAGSYFGALPPGAEGSGFATVVTSVRGYGVVDGLLVAPGDYNSAAGVALFPQRHAMYHGTVPFPIDPLGSADWSLATSVTSAANPLYPRRPALLDDGSTDAFVFVNADGPARLGVVDLGVLSDGPTPSVLHTLVPGLEVESLTRPRDVNGDGFVDLIVGLEASVGSGARNAIALVRGPFTALAPGYEVPDADLLRDVTNTAAFDQPAPVAGYACQLDDDEALELVTFEGRLSEDNQAVFSAAVYEFSDPQTRVGNLRLPGGLMGCWDLDGNGLDDLVSTPIGFGQAVVAFTRRE